MNKKDPFSFFSLNFVVAARLRPHFGCLSVAQNRLGQLGQAGLAVAYRKLSLFGLAQLGLIGLAVAV